MGPRGEGPGDSTPSAPSTNDRDQDVPLPISPSPADSQDPTGIHTDEINETKEKKVNGRDKSEKLISSDQEMDKDKVSDKDKVEKMEVEECWLCGKEEHVCEMALPKTQVD